VYLLASVVSWTNTKSCFYQICRTILP